MIIDQKIATVEAHVAPHVEMLARFAKTSKMANVNPIFSHDVKGKNILYTIQETDR